MIRDRARPVLAAEEVVPEEVESCGLFGDTSEEDEEEDRHIPSYDPKRARLTQDGSNDEDEVLIDDHTNDEQDE